jgi:hypothetical protein
MPSGRTERLRWLRLLMRSRRLTQTRRPVWRGAEPRTTRQSIARNADDSEAAALTTRARAGPLSQSRGWRLGAPSCPPSRGRRPLVAETRPDAEARQVVRTIARVAKRSREARAPGLADRHDCDHAVAVDDVLLGSPRGPRPMTPLGHTESRICDVTHGREHEVSACRVVTHLHPRARSAVPSVRNTGAAPGAPCSAEL